MSIFTRYAMDALMKTTHPEVNRKQCWNLHPHRTPCTACKDICPYGDEIFTRPNLVKDWDPCTDCGLCVSACRSVVTMRFGHILRENKDREQSRTHIGTA